MTQNSHDVDRLLRFAQEQAAEAAELRLENRWLEKENMKLRRRLSKVYRSWTWRLGRILLFPYYLTQWIAGKLRRTPSSS